MAIVQWSEAGAVKPRLPVPLQTMEDLGIWIRVAIPFHLLNPSRQQSIMEPCILADRRDADLMLLWRSHREIGSTARFDLDSLGMRIYCRADECLERGADRLP